MMIASVPLLTSFNLWNTFILCPSIVRTESFPVVSTKEICKYALLFHVSFILISHYGPVCGQLNNEFEIMVSVSDLITPLTLGFPTLRIKRDTGTWVVPRSVLTSGYIRGQCWRQKPTWDARVSVENMWDARVTWKSCEMCMSPRNLRDAQAH